MVMRVLDAVTLRSPLTLKDAVNDQQYGSANACCANLVAQSVLGTHIKVEEGLTP